MYELGLHTYYWRVGLSVFSVLFAGSEALSLGSTPGLNLLHVCYHSPHRGKRLKTRMKYTVHTIKCGFAEIADYTVTYSNAHKANLKVQFMALSFPINTRSAPPASAESAGL